MILACASVIKFFFRQKNSLERKNIQFSSRRFFLCPEIAHDAQSLQVCRFVGVLYNTNVGCYRG